MAEVEMYTGDQIVLCTFCSQYLKREDNWDVYYGYAYAKSKMRKPLVLPWNLPDAEVQVEHHRSCGRTKPAGELFTTIDKYWRFYRCTKCGQFRWTNPGQSEPIRLQTLQNARDCCKEEEKT